MATVPQPDPMVATSMVTMTGGSSSGGSTKSVKEAPDVVAPIATKKATDEASVKWVVDDVAAQKVADDAAAAEKAAEETVASRATEVEMSKEVVEELVGSYSSPMPVVGAKRVATPGGSTPPAKRFRCS
jgi:hypothetical protein